MTSDYSTMTNENGNNEENEYDDGNRGGNWQFMSFLLWAMITTMLVAMMFVDSGIFLFSARFFFCLFVWESRKNKRRHFPPLPPPPTFSPLDTGSVRNPFFFLFFPASLPGPSDPVQVRFPRPGGGQRAVRQKRVQVHRAVPVERRREQGGLGLQVRRKPRRKPRRKSRRETPRRKPPE